MSHPSGELGKELPGEVIGIVWVTPILAAKIVVEDSSVGGFVDVRQAEIHAVALDSAGHAADKDYGAVRFLPLDNPDVRQRVVHLAIAVVIPRIIEKDEIAWVSGRSLVERAVLLYVRIDEAYAICVRIVLAAAVQIDPMSEKDRTGHSSTIVRDASAVALDRSGAHEFGRGLHDCVPVRHTFDGSATGAFCR